MKVLAFSASIVFFATFLALIISAATDHPEEHVNLQDGRVVVCVTKDRLTSLAISCDWQHAGRAKP